MKLRYILTSVLAMFILIVGCTTDEFNRLKEITVSQSFLGIPLEGGSASMKMTTLGNWQITAEDGKTMPEWLTISPVSGSAGTDQVVTFSASETNSGREVVLHVAVGDKVQNIIIKQAAESNEIIVSTVSEVQKGADGKEYFVRGTITKIENTVYGNWYLQDETGSLYIYGTLDKNGQAKNFLSLGLAVGDKVLIKGPRSVYNGTPQLKNVTVLEIEKSLLATDVTEIDIEDEKAADVAITVTCIGGGFDIIKPNVDWLSVKGIQVKGNDKYIVTLSCSENTAYSPRSAAVTIKHATKEEVAPVEVVIKQGAVTPPQLTIAEATAKELGTYVHIQGRIMAVGYSSYIISDGTGSMHIYKGEHKARLGDNMKIVGALGAYNKGAQIQTPALEEKMGYVKVEHGTP
jgi:hypothetical protein